MKIDNLNELKFTSIKKCIHFKYKGEDYIIQNGNMTGETSTITLYKGRCKGQTECIKSQWGFIMDLIKYKNNKRTLKNIDKEYFVQKLIKAKILER